ncbi:MAG: two-component regulator propeller domain-containing protein, partial [Candidatus Kapaibacteriota bacterium]
MNILSATIDKNGNLWCATDGGVFHFKPNSEEDFVGYNSLNGLNSIETRYIGYNIYTNEIFVGTNDGALSIFSPDKGWENILDIRKSQFTRLEVNHILFQDSIAFISGGFGFTTFDVHKKVFLKTPARLGNFPNGTYCNHSVIFGNHLWVATELGVARIQMTEKITNPTSWENFTSSNGLKDQNVLFLATDTENLYAFSKNEIYKFNGTNFETFMTLESYEKINCVQVFDGKIYFSTTNFVRDLNNQLLYFINESPQRANINGFLFLTKDQVAIFLNKSGLVLKNITKEELKFYLPKSPISNQFTYFDVAPNGGFWSATNSDPRGEGLMFLKDANWTNFTTFLHPKITTNNFTKVTCVEDTVYASSWGEGLFIIYPSSDSFVIKNYNSLNSPLTGIPANPNYVVVEQTIYQPSKSILWIVNYSDAKTGHLLISLDKFGKFHGFIRTPLRKFNNILIDEFGTKWISSKDGAGLYYFNERNTLEDTTDDVLGNLTWSVSLPSTNIYSMAYDKNGYIWCGTGQGIFLILNPGAVLNNSNPIIRKLKLLEDYSINCIHIDALNYKWIATSKGIFVLSPDASDIVLTLTKENSPILSNDVTYIKSNPADGKYYFGTNKGLVVANSLIVQPLDNYQISVSPQPLYLPQDQYLLIDGLAMDTEIKI